MEELGRRVRAYSDNTGRPYYSIDYKLPIAGAEGAGFHDVDAGFVEVLEYDSGEATPVLPGGNSAAERRNSELVASSTSSHLAESSSSSVAAFHQTGPSTPTSQHRKKPHTPFPPPPSSASSSPISPPQQHKSPLLPEQPHPIRRVKSASTMQEIELNRTAPAVLHPFSSPSSSSSSSSAEQGALPGFVTCLNSRNVGKYKVGQRYRDGVVLGIDDDHGKIIVYNDNLPRGALTVLRTQNAARYDRGFVLEDVRGGLLGTVHALDRVQNLLVLNTSSTTGDASLDAPAPLPASVIKGSTTVKA